MGNIDKADNNHQLSKSYVLKQEDDQENVKDCYEECKDRPVASLLPFLIPRNITSPTWVLIQGVCCTTCNAKSTRRVDYGILTK